MANFLQRALAVFGHAQRHHHARGSDHSEEQNAPGTP
jgi:hypothetical protein